MHLRRLKRLFWRLILSSSASSVVNHGCSKACSAVKRLELYVSVRVRVRVRVGRGRRKREVEAGPYSIISITTSYVDKIMTNTNKRLSSNIGHWYA